MEDGRQPATNDVRPARRRHSGRRLDAVRGVGRVVDGVRRCVVHRACGTAGGRAGCVPRRAGISMRGHLRAVRSDVVVAAAHVVLGITFLAHQAWLMVDAIVRTLARVYVTRRHLLEWETAAQVKAEHNLAFGSFYRQMAGGVVIAGVSCTACLRHQSGRHRGSPRRSSFCGCWRRPSPAGSACPPRNRRPSNSPTATSRRLRLLARRTWLFFETFVGPDDHCLPPDNFQDDPTAGRRASHVADEHRDVPAGHRDRP